MVNLLIGPKGSGKTKQMFDLANTSAKEINGNVVFIKNSHNETSSLSHSIRVVVMKDYKAIANADEYIGFLYGMISANHDIEVIYIDGLLKLDKIAPADLVGFINRVKLLSERENIDFFVSCSVPKEALCNIVDCNIIN
ncbi:MAG: hypothetical protein R3Y58_03600 [Eubacteriales bacterium]